MSLIFVLKRKIRNAIMNRKSIELKDVLQWLDQTLDNTFTYNVNSIWEGYDINNLPFLKTENFLLILDITLY